MTSYKSIGQIFFAIVLNMSVGMCLVSCMKRDERARSEQNATFYVDSITPTIDASKTNFGQVNQKFINMRACLKDFAEKAVIMGETFQIFADNVEIKHLDYNDSPPSVVPFTTDLNGCITWQELFQFNPELSERQIVMNRKFVALEGQSGSVMAQLSYIPWKDNMQFLTLGLKAEGADTSATVEYAAGGMVSKMDVASNSTVQTQVDLQAQLKNSDVLVPLYLSSIDLTFLKRDFANYDLNKLLELTIAHSYRLKFNLQAIRNTMTTGQTLVTVNEGQFKFYFYLMDEGYDGKKMSPAEAANHVVGSTTFTTQGKASIFTQDVSLKFTKIAALANRMTGVITVESIDQPDVYSTQTFEGMVTPVAAATNPSIDLIQSGIDGKALDAAYTLSLQRQSDVTGLKILANQANFSPAVAGNSSQGNPAIVNYDYASVLKNKAIPTDDANFENALCFSYFNKSYTPDLQAASDACYKAASSGGDKMVIASVREFIVDIGTYPNDNLKVHMQKIPETEEIDIATDFDLSDTSSEEQGATLKNDVNAYGNLGAELNIDNILGFLAPVKKVAGAVIDKIPFIQKFTKLFGITANTGLKVSSNGDWYHSTGLVQNQSTDAKTNATRTQKIESEAFTFSFNATTTTCVLIVPTPALQALMGKNAPAQKGKTVCADQNEIGERTETYYFINQTNGTSGSPLSDNMSSDDNPMRMFVRGPNTYDLLSELLSQSDFNIKLQKVSVRAQETQLSDQLKNYKNNVSEEFPGMLLPKVTTPPETQALTTPTVFSATGPVTQPRSPQDTTLGKLKAGIKGDIKNIDKKAQ